MEENILKNRSWIEIDLNNLEHNINEIKKIISNESKIMAVVKANAYGHGIIEISHKLNELGITDFAVATLNEGINLRKNNIVGNIFILGYTSIENLEYVVKYDLIQTVVDEEYAREILQVSLSKKIKVHLKINTGMNRIGLNPKNVEFIKSLYLCNNLEVLGIFSHLCASDSNIKEDILFTKKQIEIFDNLIEKLKILNINVGKTHLQSSYGILNYQGLKYDYVRPGIIMYGVHSDKAYTNFNINLKPVLSLKARVASIKEINVGDTVSYGRMYKALQKEKIATISIGYADGYLRNLSFQNTKVLINNQYAEIIGKICMDQLMVNVTDIDNIKQGDIVTLIGQEPEISATEIARKANSITNELLCRLGSRLETVVVKKY